MALPATMTRSESTIIYYNDSAAAMPFQFLEPLLNVLTCYFTHANYFDKQAAVQNVAGAHNKMY